MVFLLTLVLSIDAPVFTLEATPHFIDTDSYNLMSFDVDDQHFVLLLRSEPYIRVFHISGRPVSQWGSKGQGPGEFTSVQDVALAGDRIWVLNKLPNRISIFSLDGEFKNSIKLENCVLPAYLHVVDGIGIVQDGGWYLPKNDLFLIERDQKTKIHTLDLGKTEELKPSSGPAFNAPSPYAARDNWAFFDDGRLVLNNKGQNVLVFRLPKGGNQDEWQLEKHEHRVTLAAFDLWLNRYFPNKRRGMVLPIGPWRNEALKVSPPRTFPPTINLIADGDKLWVHRAYRLKDQYWECYRDGKMVWVLTFPIHYRVHGIQGKRVYATDLDNDDHPFVVFSMR